MKRQTIQIYRNTAGIGVLAGILLSCSCPAESTPGLVDQISLHPDTPRYTVDQILNNDMPGRKASPVVEAKHNAEGFAGERLYSVPPAGVHPRILFGPDDLPRIRQQIEESAEATEILKQMREWTADNLSGPAGWGAKS